MSFIMKDKCMLDIHFHCLSYLKVSFRQAVKLSAQNVSELLTLKSFLDPLVHIENWKDLLPSLWVTYFITIVNNCYWNNNGYSSLNCIEFHTPEQGNQGGGVGNSSRWLQITANCSWASSGRVLDSSKNLIREKKKKEQKRRKIMKILLHFKMYLICN